MQFSGSAVALFLGLMLVLGLLVAYASGVGRRAHKPIPDVPTGNPAMERKVVVILALLVLTGLLLNGYGMVESRRQEEALTRQEAIGIARGIETYTTLCMGCHGIDGTGAVVPGTNPPLVAPALNRPDLQPDPKRSGWLAVGCTGYLKQSLAKEEDQPWILRRPELAIDLESEDVPVEARA